MYLIDICQSVKDSTQTEEKVMPLISARYFLSVPVIDNSYHKGQLSYQIPTVRQRSLWQRCNPCTHSGNTSCHAELAF